MEPKDFRGKIIVEEAPGLRTQEGPYDIYFSEEERDLLDRATTAMSTWVETHPAVLAGLRKAFEAGSFDGFVAFWSSHAQAEADRALLVPAGDVALDTERRAQLEIELRRRIFKQYTK